MLVAKAHANALRRWVHDNSGLMRDFPPDQPHAHIQELFVEGVGNEWQFNAKMPLRSDIPCDRYRGTGGHGSQSVSASNAMTARAEAPAMTNQTASPDHVAGRECEATTEVIPATENIAARNDTRHIAASIFEAPTRVNGAGSNEVEGESESSKPAHAVLRLAIKHRRRGSIRASGIGPCTHSCRPHIFGAENAVEEGAMPFSSLSDPVDLARAQAALDAAWNDVRSTIPDAFEERERSRLAYIVAALVNVAEDEDELMRRAVERYRQSAVA